MDCNSSYAPRGGSALVEGAHAPQLGVFPGTLTCSLPQRGSTPVGRTCTSLPPPLHTRAGCVPSSRGDSCSLAPGLWRSLLTRTGTSGLRSLEEGVTAGALPGWGLLSTAAALSLSQVSAPWLLGKRPEGAVCAPHCLEEGVYKPE